MSHTERVVTALLDFQYTSAVPVFYDPQREIQELYCDFTPEQRREFRGWLVRFHLGLEYAAKEERDARQNTAYTDETPL